MRRSVPRAAADRASFGSRSSSTPVFHCGSPETVVEGAYEGLLGSIDRANYDVAPDGRILLIKNPGVDGRRTQVRLILNFFDDLARRQ